MQVYRLSVRPGSRELPLCPQQGQVAGAKAEFDFGGESAFQGEKLQEHLADAGSPVTTGPSGEGVNVAPGSYNASTASTSPALKAP